MAEPDEDTTYSVRVLCSNCGFGAWPDREHLRIEKGTPVYIHPCPNCKCLELTRRGS